MAMRAILERIGGTPDCIVSPPAGLPKVRSDHTLPSDLQEFYGLCGGIKFFTTKAYTMEIVAPQNFVLANPEILSSGWEQYVPKDDISNDWYIVAQAGVEQRISIDLGKERLGRCYDSFWDRHASPGESPIVATCFTDLLEQIFRASGGYWFWLADSFKSLGDAYD